MPNLGIDATNLSRGGGVTHIVELLCAIDKGSNPFEQVTIYGSEQLFKSIPNFPWLQKHTHPLLNSGILSRIRFLLFYFTPILKINNISLLFVPGGLYLGRFRPYVTMCQNMLVFEETEAARYGFSRMYLRLRVLRKLQTITFQRANSVIFLSEYARNYVLSKTNLTKNRSYIIHHGVSSKFSKEPRVPRMIDECYTSDPFKLVYVSILDVYKHQDILMDAVQLLSDKYPLELTFVGGEYPHYGKMIRQKKASGNFGFVNIMGFVDYQDINEIYKNGDLLLFASSCENMPNILVEMMSSGVAIACSKKGPMPEFLDDKGEYFDPENKYNIAEVIEKLILDPDLRLRNAIAAYKKSKEFTWEHCAKETLQLLNKEI